MARLLGVELDSAIGKLARFWWWCLKFAPTGDLRKHTDERLGDAVALNGDEAKRFVEAMVQSCWIDRHPYFRVHDWWDYAGAFLRGRYKNDPKFLESIKKSYSRVTPELLRNSSGATPATVPNLPTVPNQKKKKEKKGNAPEKIGALVPDRRAPPGHVQFVEGFQSVYQELTGQPFNVDQKHWVLAARLVKAHGYDPCVQKARILGEMCRHRSAWFTRDGFASFTIETLSSKWNNIIPGTAPPSKEDELKEELRKQKVIRERTDSLVK